MYVFTYVTWGIMRQQTHMRSLPIVVMLMLSFAIAFVAIPNIALAEGAGTTSASKNQGATVQPAQASQGELAQGNTGTSTPSSAGTQPATGENNISDATGSHDAGIDETAGSSRIDGTAGSHVSDSSQASGSTDPDQPSGTSDTSKAQGTTDTSSASGSTDTGKATDGTETAESGKSDATHGATGTSQKDESGNTSADSTGSSRSDTASDTSSEKASGTSDSQTSGSASTSDSSAEDAEFNDIKQQIHDIFGVNAVSFPGVDSSVLKIAIDPGHGSRDTPGASYDTGATANGLYESNLTRRIAEYIKSMLSQYSNVEVYMTHYDGEQISLNERVDRAAAAGCQVFISIHINAGGGSGFEVLVPNNSNYQRANRDAAWGLGNDILNHLCGDTGMANRGFYKRDCDNGCTYPDGSIGDYFTVINEARLDGMIGILVEHGFIDGPSIDVSYLSSDSGLHTLAAADVAGIVQYFGLTKGPLAHVSGMGSHSITLSWNPVSGASKYAIARVLSDGTFITYTYDCTGTSYTITGLNNGDTYSFLVQSYANGAWSTFNHNDYVTVELVPSPTVHVTYTGDGTVTLTWDAVDATCYAIAEWLGTGQNYHTFTYNCTNDTYTITDLPNEITHAFIVQANINGVWSPLEFTYQVTATPHGPVKPTAHIDNTTATTISLSWNRVSGATKYAIARKLPGSGDYDTYTYDCTGTSYVLHNLEQGENYQILVQAFVDGKWSAYSDADLVSTTTSLVPSPSVHIVRTSDGSVTLGWTPVSGASQYAVAEWLGPNQYRTFTYNCTGTEYTVSNLSNYVRHGLFVQAYVDGDWSPLKYTYLTMATPEGAVKPSPTVSSVSDSAVTLTWNPVAGAARYAIASYDGNSMYTTYTYDCTDNSYTVYGLNPGTTYEFLVQANINNNWSAFTTADHVRATTTGGLAIMGRGQATVSQMARFFARGNSQFPSAYASQGINSIEDFANTLIDVANSENVSYDVAFCQEMLETNYLKFNGVVDISQYNFAGMGANSNTGQQGNSFSSVREGMLAQVQHLKAYGSTAALNNSCVDPRFRYVSRGCAPLVDDLSGRWAGSGYGQQITRLVEELRSL